MMTRQVGRGRNWWQTPVIQPLMACPTSVSSSWSGMQGWIWRRVILPLPSLLPLFLSERKRKGKKGGHRLRELGLKRSVMDLSVVPPPGRYLRLDLFIKVLSLLCPNLTDASLSLFFIWKRKRSGWKVAGRVSDTPSSLSFSIFYEKERRKGNRLSDTFLFLLSQPVNLSFLSSFLPLFSQRNRKGKEER